MIELVMSWWAQSGKDSGLMWSVRAMVCTGASIAGKEQTGEAGLWGKMLVSLKSMVKFPLALTTSRSTARTLQTC